jgi:hypothetical protein
MDMRIDARRCHVGIVRQIVLRVEAADNVLADESCLLRRACSGREGSRIHGGSVDLMQLVRRVEKDVDRIVRLHAVELRHRGPMSAAVDLESGEGAAGVLADAHQLSREGSRREHRHGRDRRHVDGVALQRTIIRDVRRRRAWQLVDHKHVRAGAAAQDNGARTGMKHVIAECPSNQR